jgi:acetoin utilization protein AcuB
MTLKIEDVMTRAPHTIGDDQTVASAKHEMLERGIRHLPVLRGGHCVGMISDRDVKLAYATDGSSAGDTPVREVCSADVYTVRGAESVNDVAAHLAASGIGSAVIVDDREKVIGIFTVTDACRVLAHHLA